MNKKAIDEITAHNTTNTLNNHHHNSNASTSDSEDNNSSTSISDMPHELIDKKQFLSYMSTICTHAKSIILTSARKSLCTSSSDEISAYPHSNIDTLSDFVEFWIDDYFQNIREYMSEKSTIEYPSIYHLYLLNIINNSEEFYHQRLLI
jgi:hypothetical protein